MKIPFYRPAGFSVPDYFRFYQTLRKGWLTSGPQNQRLKVLLEEYLNSSRIITLNSATSGLKLALHVKKIGKGDEVILPVNTFFSTLEVVHQAGAIPVLADIDPDTWTISTEEIRRKITQKTRAIIPVNFAGNAPDMEKIFSFAKEKQILIIYDNAHGIGDRAEQFADITVFSFYATKNITTGEGGAMIFANEEDYRKAEPLVLHGMDKKSWNRYQKSNHWKYDILDAGFKYNLPDVNAVLALSQVKYYEQNLVRRESLYKLYKTELEKFSWVRFQRDNPDFRNVHHLLPVWIENDGIRDKIMDALENAGIGYSLHFIPLYEFSFVKKKYRFLEKNFPVMREYYKNIISLPFYLDLKKSAIRKISDIFSKFDAFL